MKKIKVLLLVIMVIGLFQGNLFSIIYSRVQGVVQDESGQPIVNAVVRLYTIERKMSPQQETDASGKFKFDDVKSGEYFLQVFKEGYAAFGPMMNYDRMVNGTGDYPPSRQFGTFVFRKRVPINSFNVKEGQIKHLIIRLKKEAVLVLKVTPIGANVTREFQFEFMHSDYCDNVKNIAIGEYRSKCLSAGKVDIDFYVHGGFPKKSYKGVEIKAGETTTIEYVMDFSKGQVIHGVVIDKETKKPLKADITIYGAQRISSSSNENGEYWLGGITPGKYEITIRGRFDPSLAEGHKYHEAIIQISENEKKEFNVEI